MRLHRLRMWLAVLCVCLLFSAGCGNFEDAKDSKKKTEEVSDSEEKDEKKGEDSEDQSEEDESEDEGKPDEDENEDKESDKEPEHGDDTEQDNKTEVPNKVTPGKTEPGKQDSGKEEPVRPVKPTNVGKAELETLMIYIIGADLESEYGSATLDILEMVESSVNVDYHNVVIYAGGTSEWQNDRLSPREDSILLLDGQQDVTVVETMRRKNMSAPETLSYFVNYCFDNFKADHYSLILWDHGSGPVFGYGVDETGKDTMLLPELRQALNDSVGARGECLEWIGFDACLMSSLEVADVVAPYAKYMIASQETEPGWGWCYYFLSELDGNKFIPGDKLAKEIVDSYIYYVELCMEENPSFYCDVTLSCLDLRKYQKAEDALNEFFSDLTEELDTEAYGDIIKNRQNTREFGKYSTGYDFDLVDVIHMLERFSGNPSAVAAKAAVEDMIVYSDTNMKNANGVSMCYPYDAEADYRAGYLAVQKEIGFVEAYGDYLESMTGTRKEKKKEQKKEEVWDLTEAQTQVQTVVSDAANKADTSDVSLQLTKEQQNNLARAGYWIMCNAEKAGFTSTAKDPRAEELYLLVHQGKDVTLDENGVLHAYYGNEAMYMRDATTGEYSVFPMVLFEEERTDAEVRYTSFGVLSDMESDDLSEWRVEAADIQIAVNEEYPDGIIRYVVPLADNEGIVSPSKQLPTLDEFTFLSVTSSAKYFTRGKQGEMISYNDWEPSGWQYGFEMVLENGYSLECRPLENPENYSCIFFLVDLEGDVTYSEMIPLG